MVQILSHQLAGAIIFRVFRLAAVIAVCGSALGVGPIVVAADPAPDSKAQGAGRLVRILLPLVGNADQHIKGVIERAVDALTSDQVSDGRRPILILELSPARHSQDFGVGSEFERAQSLARFLTTDRRLAAVKTVAYLPRSIKGHGVLVAMACEEIVMRADAEVGDAGADEDVRQRIEPVIFSLYQQIAQSRRTVPEAIALGMLDPRLEVHKVRTDSATEFVLADELEQVREASVIIEDEILIPAGATAAFLGREGRQYGFVKYLADNRQTLARVLHLPASAVVEDQSLVGDWRPVMIDLDGPITRRRVGQIKTLIAAEKDERNVNWIGLRIDSSGGELEHSFRLANVIAKQDPSEVRLVAYVPVEAGGGAAMVALACDQIIIQPAAKIGGPGSIVGDKDPLSEGGLDALKSFAENSNHSWSLMAAMFSADVEVFVYTNTITGEERYFSPDEVAELDDADDWKRGPRVTTPDEPLVLDSSRALDLGVAWQVVDNFEEFKQFYGFEDEPRIAKPNWALELVEALSSPGFAALLLFAGFLGIYLELHSPGFGVGGFIAAVAFLLFFWSNYLEGTAGWLEVLLFVVGLFFILLEFFVLPGFGIFGLGGSVMVVLSLVLASQTFLLPQSEADLVELRNSLAVLIAAGAMVIAAALGLRRWLPEAPILRTFLLNPLENEELADLEHRESVADFSHLVGQRGTAATDLMPAGKAEVDGTLVDVIADGEVVDRGTEIEVVETHGNRVLVRATAV